MRRTPVSSATGEQLRAGGCFRTPPRRARRAANGRRCVTQGPVRRFIGHGYPRPASPLVAGTRRLRAVVRPRTRLGHDGDVAGAPADGAALRRAGTAGRSWSRGAEPGRPDRSGGGGRAADAAAGGRGQRRRGARSARLAGVGRNRSRPVRRRYRRAHRRPGAAGPAGELAGGRGLAAAPGPCREAERSLPALGGFGSSGGDAPDLVRLVDAAATECHRVRLAHARNHLWAHQPTGQPLAFS